MGCFAICTVSDRDRLNSVPDGGERICCEVFGEKPNGEVNLTVRENLLNENPESVWVWIGDEQKEN